MTDPASALMAEEGVAIEPLTTSRILLVDDSAVMLSVIRKYLEVHGFNNIQVAANGEEALHVAHAWRPDLILTDIQMPVMDGYELCRQIRAGTEMPDVPVLFMTGLTKPEDRNGAFSAGASDLISKPVDHLELVGRLRVHLDRRRLIKRLFEYHDRMAQELVQARQMQEAILPGVAVQEQVQAKYPVRFGSFYRASIGLGGDLWSIHQLGPERLMVCLVDFSGHGVGAALNTFRFQTFLNNAAPKCASPNHLLGMANTFLYTQLPRGQFATMFCGLIDFSKETLSYASASAPPVVVGDQSTDRNLQLLKTAGLPLGLVEDGDYEALGIDFKPGSFLLMYSDALIETPEPPLSIFSPDTLCALISASEVLEPDRLVEDVVSHLLSNSASGPDDDLTLVCLNYCP
ncbi:PP2C family protein-serine/threonine phosphatase [Roseibium sp.]|uniref:PP2C family protein-serine/threonine phosphatase n=1 Tax=Roseibium sp. TaxID=1936156 RepID=UPI003B528807